MWNRSPVQVWFMKQGTQSQCTGTTLRDGKGGRWEGSSGWGTHVHPWLIHDNSVQFSCSVASDSVTPWIAARQASLYITSFQSLPKPVSIESVMPSSHLIFCCPLRLLPPIPPSIRVFPMSQLFTWGGQSTGVSASTSVLPMSTQDWSPLGWTG